MSSAWGDSWGTAWADSWGATAPAPTPGRSGLGGDDVPRESPHKGWNRAEWKRLKKDPLDEIENTLRAAYADLTGDEAPLCVLARVDAAVRPIMRVEAEAPRIDWERITRERANLLLLIWQEELALRDDEEEALLLYA